MHRLGPEEWRGKTEAEVTRAIILATSHLVAWDRNNVSRVGFDTEGEPCAINRAVRVVCFGLGGKGGADWVGARRSDGKAVYMEVKRWEGKPTKEQIEFLERKARETKAIVMIARNPMEALQWIEEVPVESERMWEHVRSMGERPKRFRRTRKRKGQEDDQRMVTP